MQTQPGFGVWTYRPDVTSGSKIVDYTVEATDGRIGKIDKASDDADAAHMVVDTGFWIFGQKRLIPAGVISSVDDVERRVAVNMTQGSDQGRPRLGRAGQRRLEGSLRRVLRTVRLLIGRSLTGGVGACHALRVDVHRQLLPRLVTQLVTPGLLDRRPVLDHQLADHGGTVVADVGRQRGDQRW